jgi:hypothetical protein
MGKMQENATVLSINAFNLTNVCYLAVSVNSDISILYARISFTGWLSMMITR